MDLCIFLRSWNYSIAVENITIAEIPFNVSGVCIAINISYSRAVVERTEFYIYILAQNGYRLKNKAVIESIHSNSCNTFRYDQ